jgi:prolyl oligopeptidase
MHLYSGAPARFGMLGYQAWRASRLVVDTGMHALRWDREKALQFLRDHATLTPEEAANEIDRYAIMPGQALGYMVGEVELLRLRQRARERLGTRFDLKAFHEVVLRRGAVPMQALVRLVDEWVESPRSP